MVRPTLDVSEIRLKQIISKTNGRMITLEYILIKEVNDSFADARELVKIAKNKTSYQVEITMDEAYSIYATSNLDPYTLCINKPEDKITQEDLFNYFNYFIYSPEAIRASHTLNLSKSISSSPIEFNNLPCTSVLISIFPCAFVTSFINMCAIIASIIP